MTTERARGCMRCFTPRKELTEHWAKVWLCKSCGYQIMQATDFLVYYGMTIVIAETSPGDAEISPPTPPDSTETDGKGSPRQSIRDNPK